MVHGPNKGGGRASNIMSGLKAVTNQLERKSHANVDEAPLRAPDGARYAAIASPARFYADRNHGRDRDSRHSRRVDRAQDHEPPGRSAPRGGEGGYWLGHAGVESLST